MLHEIFYFVLNMSITAALICLVLLIIRAVLGRWLSKSVAYALWGLVLLRLLIPVSLASEWSLFNRLSTSLTKTVPLPQEIPLLPQISMLNSIRAANTYFPLDYRTEFLRTFFSAAGVIWLGGVVILMLVFLLLYCLTAAQLRKAVPWQGSEQVQDILKEYGTAIGINRELKLLQSKIVVSPIVFGFINPKIIVPPAISGQSMPYVLLHELTHIRRRDNFWKAISLAAACIHWFNPLVWLSLYLAEQDREMACDEKVLSRLPEEDKRSYGEALVSLAARQQQTAFSAFGSTAVKRRLVHIISGRRVPLYMTLITALLCLVLVLSLLTNPV